MKNKIRSFIAETTFVDPDIIKDNTLIFNEGIFDSMGLLGLINFLETEFGIVPDDSELREENFGRIERRSDYINRKMAIA